MFKILRRILRGLGVMPIVAIAFSLPHASAFFSARTCTYDQAVTTGTIQYLSGFTCNNVATGNNIFSLVGPTNNVSLGTITANPVVATTTTTGNKHLQSDTNRINLGSCTVFASNVTNKVLTGVVCPSATFYTLFTGATGSTGATGPTGDVTFTISGYTLGSLGTGSSSGSYYTSTLASLDTITTDYVIASGAVVDSQIKQFGEQLLTFGYGSLPYLMGFVALIIIVISLKNILFRKNQYGGKKSI